MTEPEPGVVYAEMKRIALIAAAGLVLAGCGSTNAASPAPPHFPRVIHSPIVTSTDRPHRARLHMSGFVQLVSPTRLAIATWGSSSCPSVPDELVVQSRHAIRIHLVTGSWTRGGPVARPPANGICTADLGTAQMLVTIDPEQLDVHRPLKVSFVYRDSKKPQVWTAAPLGVQAASLYPAIIHSPAVALAKKLYPIHELPRFVSPTRLAIATWGSLTCPGVPYEILVNGPHAISMTVAPGVRTLRGIEAQPPKGCTLDLRLTQILVAIDPKLVDVHHPVTIRGVGPVHLRGGKKPYVETAAPLQG